MTQVNRYLENKAMDHIDHALGRPVDPTPEVAMARRIAADTWGLTGPNRQAVINGEWDDIRQVRCALAAIIETSEMAAKLNDEYESFIRLGSVGDAATALRAYDHIKPENG